MIIMKALKRPITSLSLVVAFALGLVAISTWHRQRGGTGTGRATSSSPAASAAG
jgi:hypothetical protein